MPRPRCWLSAWRCRWWSLARIALAETAAATTIAAIGTAVYLPLHLRHVREALRGERPAYSWWTLAVMAAVLVVAVVGQSAGLLLASLACSVPLLVRAPLSLFAVVAILGWAAMQGSAQRKPQLTRATLAGCRCSEQVQMYSTRTPLTGRSAAGAARRAGR